MTAQRCVITNAVTDKNVLISDENSIKTKKEELVYHRKIYLSSVISLVYLHAAGFYGLYLTFSAKAATNIFTIICMGLVVLGVTAGAHRLWSHRAYKATLSLRIFLMILQTSGYQKTIFHWARDHRCHHKYVDTDGDPHNIKRGFIFSHIGWLVLNKHPLLLRKRKDLDVSDLEQDGVVMFQKRFYYILMPLLCFILPTLVPMCFWDEFFNIAFHSAVLRYIYGLNVIWLVNSLNHAVGQRPYDENISPRENIFLVFLALGEGFHNHHHAFPRDYRTGEFGGYLMTLTAVFIDVCAWLGLASDLKTTSPEMLAKRIARTGDGSHIIYGDKYIETTDDDEIFGKLEY